MDHLSFAVEEKEVFGLVGPNGAGKSTMIKILTTLIAPTSGTARINGFDVVKEPSTVRRQIGYGAPDAVFADGDLTAMEKPPSVLKALRRASRRTACPGRRSSWVHEPL